MADHAGSSFEAVSALIRQGHRRIAMLTGSKAVYSFKERLVGYLRGLSGHGIRYDDGLVIEGRDDFATGYRGLQKLMKLKDPPTAAFCASYNITLGLITAAGERNLTLPENLTVCGFDCAEICSMVHPPLSAVHQPEQLIGQRSAEFMVERLQGYSGPPRVLSLKCTLDNCFSPR